jgi:dolichol-phosphate mannosyltransferase
MPRTMILIPTYNEADNLPSITKALFELNVDGLEILVIDDASPDGTGQVAEQLAEQHPGHFHVLHRAGKLGIGTAYVEGFHWALERGAEYLIQMDADFSHSPEHIPQMLDAIRDYDLVVGSRYVKGGRLDERWGVGRKFLSWWANSIWVHFILGMKTRDATTGFKCWRADALRQIKIERVRSNGYIFLVEICYLAEKLGLRIKEIPIYFAERCQGESKMSTRIQVEAALRVFEIRRRYRRVGEEAHTERHP